MIAVDLFKNKTIGILGLARSGLSTANVLQAGGARIVAWDDKKSARDGAPQAVRVESWEQWPWEDLAVVVASPGISLTHPAPHPAVQRANDAGIEIVGDIDLFARSVHAHDDPKHPAPVIAITDEPVEQLDPFFARAPDFPAIVAVDDYRQGFQAYGVSGTPTFVLVDADGRISSQFSGYSKQKGLGEAVQAMVARHHGRR